MRGLQPPRLMWTQTVRAVAEVLAGVVVVVSLLEGDAVAQGTQAKSAAPPSQVSVGPASPNVSNVGRDVNINIGVAPARSKLSRRQLRAGSYALGKHTASLSFYRAIGEAAQLPNNIKGQLQSEQALMTGLGKQLSLDIDPGALSYVTLDGFPPWTASDTSEIGDQVEQKYGANARQFYQFGLQFQSCWLGSIGKKLGRGSLDLSSPWGTRTACIDECNTMAKLLAIKGIDTRVVWDDDDSGVRLRYELQKLDMRIGKAIKIAG